MYSSIFVTGIHTNIGKTIASACLVEALKASYWKPIQAGDLQHTDSDTIKQLVSFKLTCFPSTYALQTAASPHYAANIEQITIDIEQFKLPKSNNTLIIEGAGGLCSPINDEYLNLDLILHLKVPVVLVINNYLGSINHSILTIQMLQQAKVKLLGIIFVGDKVVSSETFILNYTNVNKLGYIPFTEQLNKQFIVDQAQQFKTIV